MLRRFLLKQALTSRQFLLNKTPSPSSTIPLPTLLNSHFSFFSSSSESEKLSGNTFAVQLEGSAENAPTTVSVDRTGLCNPPEHSHEQVPESDLVKHLKGIIKFRGVPITVAEYMEEVLTNPKAGFYINRDVFGAEGDFITSPEVSQMFGEFLGSLGINFRVEALLPNCTDEQTESLRTGYWRLVGDGESPFWEGPDEQAPIGMGTRYLAMAIVNKQQGVPVPFQ